MRCGGKVMAAVALCILLTGSMAEVNIMEDTMSEMRGNLTNVRQSPSLSTGEKEYIQKRKEVVMEALHNLGINCTTGGVPHIALLASGGGQRAAVSLIGSLYQLHQDALLDTLMYLGGVSGSTWGMVFLYRDPAWSSTVAQAVYRLAGPGVTLEQALLWLEERAKEEGFSLSDIWGVYTSAAIMKLMSTQCLSEEAGRNASNPYPVYSALEKHCYTQGEIQGQWFEVTPDEAGFTELGLYVNTSLLGSSFHRGQLQEARPEMDMVQLQGVLGCAIAHEDTLRDLTPPWMNVPAHIDSAMAQYLSVYQTVVMVTDLIRSNTDSPSILSSLEKLQNTLEDKKNRNESLMLESKSPDERKYIFHDWSLEMLRALEEWCHTLEEGLIRKHALWLSKQLLPLVVKWEWGATRNFLYKYPDPAVPACLRSEETLHLIDAGMLINVPYPPFLGDRRDVDLMLVPEYSAGDMFETLTLGRDYAAKVGKPFPKIDDKVLLEKDWPRDCYVFQGEGREPTIVYMPLFNRRNCKDADEIKARREEFATFQRPFSQEKIEAVLEIAKDNMRNSKDTILREIHNAVLRRQNKA